MSAVVRVVVCVTGAMALTGFAPAWAVGQEAEARARTEPSWTYLDAWPAPALRDDLGGLSLPISTANQTAQAYFDQGLAMHHGFWDIEAYRAFREAARIDPAAPMVHWGLYIAVGAFAPTERRAEGDSALARAKALAEHGTDAERRYIRAVALRDSIGGAEGKAAYEAELEALIEEHPEQVHARLLLARSLGYGQPYAKALLSEVVASHPEVAAGHHYWLHAYENVSVERALPSARVIAELAPAIPHLVHMPGHTYFAMGEYDRAIEAFTAAARVDAAYDEKTGVRPIDNTLASHNLHYLAMALAEAGRRARAVALTDSLRDRVSLEPDRNRALQRFSYYHQGLVAPVRVAIRFSDWDGALRALDAIPADDPGLYGATTPVYRQAVAAFVRGQKALAEGRLDDAVDWAARLDAHLWRSERDGPFPDWLSRLLSPLSLELAGEIALAGGDTERAIAQFEAAVAIEDAIVGMTDPPYYARPTREGLANARTVAGDFDGALETWDALLEHRPNSGFALYGVARTLEAAGRDVDAAAAYRRFLEAWHAADPDLPQVKAAHTFLRRH